MKASRIGYNAGFSCKLLAKFAKTCY